MARIGPILVLLMAALLAPAVRASADILDFDVSWTIHSTFSLRNGTGGVVDLQGQGPGTVAMKTFEGVRLFDFVSFSDGKSGGSAGPLANNVIIVNDSHPHFTTGLPTEVETARMERVRNGVSFRIDDGLTAFDAFFGVSNDCFTPSICPSVQGWTSDLTAHGVRHVATAEPVSTALVVAGLGLSVVRRRRR